MIIRVEITHDFDYGTEKCDYHRYTLFKPLTKEQDELLGKASDFQEKTGLFVEKPQEIRLGVLTSCEELFPTDGFYKLEVSLV